MRISVELGFSFKNDLDADYRQLLLPEESDVEAAVQALASRHPAARQRLLDDAGRVRRHVAAFVNGGERHVAARAAHGPARRRPPHSVAAGRRRVDTGKAIGELP